MSMCMIRGTCMGFWQECFEQIDKHAWVASLPTSHRCVGSSATLPSGPGTKGLGGCSPSLARSAALWAGVRSAAHPFAEGRGFSAKSETQMLSCSVISCPHQGSCGSLQASFVRGVLHHNSTPASSTGHEPAAALWQWLLVLPTTGRHLVPGGAGRHGPAHPVWDAGLGVLIGRCVIRTPAQLPGQWPRAAEGIRQHESRMSDCHRGLVAKLVRP